VASALARSHSGPRACLLTQKKNEEKQYGWESVYLLILAIPVACVAWTLTHEEVLRESRQYCQEESAKAHSLVAENSSTY
jgi:hypothetical protein